MKKITVQEFEKHFDKYNSLAESIEILVVDGNKELYILTPAKKKKTKDMEGIFGLLPENATIGVDPDERG